MRRKRMVSGRCRPGALLVAAGLVLMPGVVLAAAAIPPTVGMMAVARELIVFPVLLGLLVAGMLMGRGNDPEA